MVVKVWARGRMVREDGELFDSAKRKGLGDLMQDQVFTVNSTVHVKHNRIKFMVYVSH